MENQFNYVLALPEIVLTILAIVTLLSDAFFKSINSAVAYIVSLLSIALVLIISLVQWQNGVYGHTFYGHFVTDSFAHFLKIC